MRSARKNGLTLKPPPTETQDSPKSLLGPERHVKYMMFSDFAGYSTLQDQHIPAFLEFMKQVESDVHDRVEWIESINTWGDALFVVMNSASQIAEYALSFFDIVDNLGMRLYGIKPIRALIPFARRPCISLGRRLSPQSELLRQSYQPSRRIEPVTAMQQFVALLHAEQNSLRFEAEQTDRPYIPKFVTEYVGYLGLAKHFSEQIYHIRWRKYQPTHFRARLSPSYSWLLNKLMMHSTRSAVNTSVSCCVLTEKHVHVTITPRRCRAYGYILCRRHKTDYVLNLREGEQCQNRQSV
ncbi:hypothetical protein FGO68_gene11723 [Halteria grandinella]|uniref:Guanylate cyclase domain-containing protein n=1 Tax=Halteria grandinella TaxID=5974 RepID=A0A8J8NB31_HALGN|nr:hypothetical protein FGO68_gene11723 [Halteria grandinella]